MLYGSLNATLFPLLLQQHFYAFVDATNFFEVESIIQKLANQPVKHPNFP